VLLEILEHKELQGLMETMEHKEQLEHKVL
jgi:hypothetical protein